MTIEEIRKFFDNDRFATGIGCRIEEAEPDHAVITLDVEERHLNGNGVVQGGVLFTMADFACATAAYANGDMRVSADGAISYFSAGNCKKLTAVSSALKIGRSLSYYEALITDENGKKIAKGSFTMYKINTDNGKKY
ncbi:MAG: PaaI family thioesterase [Clostridiales bacterium]|nr:PaaI family thioesterase [Clostridiales bacterium]MCD7828277.1 PaaI family thioesterase [Clostridiales bacterium]